MIRPSGLRAPWVRFLFEDDHDCVHFDHFHESAQNLNTQRTLRAVLHLEIPFDVDLGHLDLLCWPSSWLGVGNSKTIGLRPILLATFGTQTCSVQYFSAISEQVATICSEAIFLNSVFSSTFHVLDA